MSFVAIKGEKHYGSKMSKQMHVLWCVLLGLLLIVSIPLTLMRNGFMFTRQGLFEIVNSRSSITIIVPVSPSFPTSLCTLFYLQRFLTNEPSLLMNVLIVSILQTYKLLLSLFDVQSHYKLY